MIETEIRGSGIGRSSGIVCVKSEVSTECDASIDYDSCDDDDDVSWGARNLRCVDASPTGGDGWWWIETGGVSRWTGVGDG